MGRSSGELDKWLIPKRCNVYQTLALLAVLEKYPTYCNFTAANQSNVATKMRVDFGASKKRTVQAQSARTTKAMAEYMGFLKSEGNQIEITEIGKKFLNNHKAELINKGYTLEKPIAQLISEAEEWKEQMVKLQLTNPSQPKCEDVSIYPFRFVLRLLKQKTYIDKEELAMFVLTATKESDFGRVSKEIDKFRAKKYLYRKKQVDKFKSTKFGNIALAQASSATYFMSMSEATGLIERKRQPIVNPGTRRKVPAIIIKPSKMTEVDTILRVYGVKTCLKFLHDERKMWDYYFCEDGINYPLEIEIHNKSKSNVLLQIDNITKGITADQEMTINAKQKDILYAVPGWDYVAHVYDFTDTTPSTDITIGTAVSKIDINQGMLSSKSRMTKSEIIREIRMLLSSSGVTERIQKQLEMYTRLTKVPTTNTKMYRGAYLEMYFGMLFEYLKSKKVIDNYESSTKINRYNIPHAMPNNADFVISVGNTNAVLEITLMRPTKTKISKEMKMEIEGAIRHMREQKDKVDLPSGKKSLGIFAPGSVNTVLTNEIGNWMRTYAVVDEKTITLTELLELLEREDKSEIRNFFE